MVYFKFYSYCHYSKDQLDGIYDYYDHGSYIIVEKRVSYLFGKDNSMSLTINVDKNVYVYKYLNIEYQSVIPPLRLKCSVYKNFIDYYVWYISLK